MKYALIAITGALLGMGFTALAGWIAWVVYKRHGKAKAKPPTNGVVCGACGTPIASPPLHVVVGATESFQYFKCPQCSTGVTVPLP